MNRKGFGKLLLALLATPALRWIPRAPVPTTLTVDNPIFIESGTDLGKGDTTEIIEVVKVGPGEFRAKEPGSFSKLFMTIKVNNND